MTSQNPIYRRLPAYAAFTHPPNPQHGILEIYDFYSSCTNTFPDNGSGATEMTNLPLSQIQPRAHNTKLRWIILQNNSLETLKYLTAGEIHSPDGQSTRHHEKPLLEPSSLRFGRFRYLQVYAESNCEMLVPETGYSPSGSAKMDPQFAIYIPYIKWNPTPWKVPNEYPSLRDYAQPSILHDALENDPKQKTIPNSLPLVVHQLWLFVTGSRTVVSYHPAANSQAAADDDVDLTAALKAEIPGLVSTDAKGTDPIMDAYIMAACLTRQACLLQLQGPMVNKPLIHFLEEKVAQLSGRRIMAYTSFYESISIGEARDMTNNAGVYSEMKLLLEIIMLIEELQSFDFVVDSQLKVITQMQQHYRTMGGSRNISEIALPLLVKTEYDLKHIKSDVERLIKNTSQIQAAVVQLLDLKQKEANLIEAKFARKRAEEAAIQTRQAAQQGRTILLFTVTTILFLPLSFFTSYFGMNVQDISGDDQNTTTQRNFWSICAPITITVVTLAMLVAFHESVRNSIRDLSRRTKHYNLAFWKGSF